MDAHDLPGEEMDDTHRALFNDHLKLNINNSIDDILLSDEWQAFAKSILKYETAPPRCQRKCSVGIRKSFES